MDKCRGCQREDLHKMCPAWGTKFYMSGEPYTKDIEKRAKELVSINGKDIKKNANHIYDFIVCSKSDCRMTFKGIITTLPDNGVFVYGANTEGRHGLGAAKTAKDKFGAVYGKVGFQGRSYGIVTKCLKVKAQPSISPETITEQIGELYEFANSRPDLEFWVAYSGNGKNLNFYTPQEMAEMFGSFDIPINIVFEQSFYELIK